MFAENSVHFSKATKQIAFETAGKRCEMCQTTYPSYDDLSYHHKYIWQYEAHYYSIRGKFVASTANVEVLCPKCHEKVHSHKPVRPTYELIDGIFKVGEILNDVETAQELAVQVVFYYFLYQSFYQS